MTTPEILQLVAVIVGPGCAAWAGVKSSVNGMREDVRTIKTDIKDVSRGLTGHAERIARLEGKRD